jgi:hypothetical protein
MGPQTGGGVRGQQVVEAKDPVRGRGIYHWTGAVSVWVVCVDLGSLRRPCVRRRSPGCDGPGIWAAPHGEEYRRVCGDRSEILGIWEH